MNLLTCSHRDLSPAFGPSDLSRGIFLGEVGKAMERDLGLKVQDYERKIIGIFGDVMDCVEFLSRHSNMFFQR